MSDTPMQYVDDPTIGETFADGPIGINVTSGNMHIDFFATRTDHRLRPAAITQHLVLRLVIPLPGAILLQQNILAMMNKLREQGVLQTTPIVPGPLTRQ